MDGAAYRNSAVCRYVIEYRGYESVFAGGLPYFTRFRILKEICLGSWKLLTAQSNQAHGKGDGVPSARHLSPAASYAVRSQLEQLLRDPTFRGSHRYSNLLRFVVDRTLEGKFQDLKERILGIEVFGRAPDYDTSIDPTVRVAANEVRKRLTAYYAKPGQEHEIRIDIPIRSYVAEFTFPIEDAPPVQPPTSPADVPVPRTIRWFRHWWLQVPAAAVVLCLAAWASVQLFTPVPAIDRFWAPALTGSGPLLVCISSAGPESSATTAGATASAGAGGQLLPSGQEAAQDVNVAVGMMDLNAINKLSGYLRRNNKDFVVRAAQGIDLADLHSGPAVVYGSYHDEWSNLLGSSLRFQFRGEADPRLRWIEDTGNPASRNWSMEASAPYDQANLDYALVTRALDPNTGQWWIGIAGLSGHATLAINQYLLDSNPCQNLQPIFQRVGRRRTCKSCSQSM